MLCTSIMQNEANYESLHTWIGNDNHFLRLANSLYHPKERPLRSHCLPRPNILPTGPSDEAGIVRFPLGRRMKPVPARRWQGHNLFRSVRTERLFVDPPSHPPPALPTHNYKLKIFISVQKHVHLDYTCIQQAHKLNTHAAVSRVLAISFNWEAKFYREEIKQDSGTCINCQVCTRVSYIDVACRSVCDRDQNGIKQ